MLTFVVCRATLWLPLCIAIGDVWDLEGKELVGHLSAIFEFFNAEKRYKSAPEKVI